MQHELVEIDRQGFLEAGRRAIDFTQARDGVRDVLHDLVHGRQILPRAGTQRRVALEQELDVDRGGEKRIIDVVRDAGSSPLNRGEVCLQ